MVCPSGAFVNQPVGREEGVSAASVGLFDLNLCVVLALAVVLVKLENPCVHTQVVARLLFSMYCRDSFLALLHGSAEQEACVSVLS